MEYFGADPRQPIEVCLEKVRGSDVYVGIIGHRYGTIVEDFGKSYTEMEYEEATRKNLPCFLCLRSDDFPIPPKLGEQDPESFGKLSINRWILQSLIFLNELLGAPQIGHFQSSGSFSKGVSATMLLSGSPYSESYMKPQTIHFHLAIK